MRKWPAVGCSTRKHGTGTHVHLLFGVSRPSPRSGGQRARRALEEARLGQHLGRAHRGDGHARALAAAGQRQARALGMDGRGHAPQGSPAYGPASMLRAGLLEGIVVATAGGAAHVASACGALGATTVALEADLGDEDAVIAAACARWAPWTPSCATPRRPSPPPGAGWRASAPASTAPGTRRARWPTRPGSPATAASSCSSARARATGAHAGALGAALENTARTLSIEWARYAIRTTADPARRRHQRRRRRHARRLPRLAGRRLLQRLRVPLDADRRSRVARAHPS